MDRPEVGAAVLSMLDREGAVVHVDNHHQDETSVCLSSGDRRQA
jgi:hypothetical protein